jgi:AraC-like DNA-binding protein
MDIELYIDQPNDYAFDIGAPVYHPHVSIISYDEAGAIRHTLNRFNVYALFLQKEFPEDLVYGIGKYDHAQGSLLAYSPGQIGGKPDDGTTRQYHGWVLMFDAAFIQGTEIERQLANYHFYSYNANEALILTDGEKEILYGLMANIRKELSQHSDEAYIDAIVKDYILLILDYCNRFYSRQFKELSTEGVNILARFQQLLTDYYEKGLQQKYGFPNVSYCARELCLSSGYFGDILRNSTGDNPKNYISHFVIMRSKNLLLSGMRISQVAEELGFEYANHFTRLFKKVTGQTPSEFLASHQQK